MKKIDDTLRNIGIAPKSPLNDQELSTYLSIVEPTLTNLKQALYTDLMELIGEEDNSPMYFAELYKGQAHDATMKRASANAKIAELRTKIKDYLGIEDEV
jgi:hypothetical protein